MTKVGPSCLPPSGTRNNKHWWEQKVGGGGGRGSLWQGGGTWFPPISVGAGHPKSQGSPVPEPLSLAAHCLWQRRMAPSWPADLISGTISSKRWFTLSLVCFNSQRPLGCFPEAGLYWPGLEGRATPSMGFAWQEMGGTLWERKWREGQWGQKKRENSKQGLGVRGVGYLLNKI